MGAGQIRTGYVEWRGPSGDKQWHTRVRDEATGRLLWVPVEADLPKAKRLKESQQGLAKKIALVLQEQWVAGGYVPTERGLTVNEFFRRWCDSRRPRMANQVATDETAFRLWISPEIGTLPFHSVTRDRLIAFSHHLDMKALDGTDFGAKRARNIFSVVSAMFRDAHKSKDPVVRILDANPCDEVPWPDLPEGEPLHQMLYPREFIALVSCPLTPVVRGRLYAIATYTATRIGEARILDCQDIDLDNALVKIVKASDSGKGRRGQKKLTKSARSRICSIEETLMPMLQQMIAERGARGRLFPDRPTNMPKGNQHRRLPVDHIPGTSKACEVFRRDLLAALSWADIKVRPELTDDSDLRESQPIRFHDLRASGITWRHARGDNPIAIRQECGHEDERTNEIYIRRLRELQSADLFPALPARLLGAEIPCPVRAQGHRKPQKSPRIGAGGGSRSQAPAEQKGSWSRELVEDRCKLPCPDGNEPSEAVAILSRGLSPRIAELAPLAKALRGIASLRAADDEIERFARALEGVS